MIFPFVLALFIAYPTGLDKYAAAAVLVSGYVLMCVFYAIKKKRDPRHARNAEHRDVRVTSGTRRWRFTRDRG
jgi:hypothetical protein